jgi:transposase
MGGRFFGGPTMLTTMTEEDWTIVLKVFEASCPRCGDKGRDDRKFLEALQYFVVHNITWRALPEKFGHWNSVWKRFWRLSRCGTFEAFFDALAALSETAHLVQMFDSTVVRAHVSAAGGNVWPAPSASGFVILARTVCTNVSGLSAMPLAKMEIRAFRSS